MRPCRPGRLLDDCRALRLALLVVCALALLAHVCAAPEPWPPPAGSSHGSGDNGSGHGEHGLLAGSCEPIATTATALEAGCEIATGAVPVAPETGAPPRAVPEPADRPPDPSRFPLHLTLRL